MQVHDQKAKTLLQKLLLIYIKPVSIIDMDLLKRFKGIYHFSYKNYPSNNNKKIVDKEQKQTLIQ